MEIKTKFEIGERVYYFSGKKGKVRKGTVRSINLFIQEKGVDELYNITPDGEIGLFLPESISPSMIFKERDDVFDFCYKLTEGI